ncbi:MAG: hypothetical protein HYZ11_12550 [Candidatus Tectomicrobia bacterium]|uniref:Lipoprotein n=1 Tax=Tectimicrobiota bacterium TaxID=2528274 RepID=A0A932MP35_UNCTE|nr:hypothetical protein [Candidatus Tectomicrobia bacterium]
MSWFQRAITLVCLAALGGCTGFYRSPEGPIGEGHRPTLEAVWAEETAGFSNLWRIYIRASDPDGDLDKVWVTFRRFGGTYPGTFVMLSQPQGAANGYIRLWVRPRGATDTVELPIHAAAEISVGDRAGNQSLTRVISFTIAHGPVPEGSVPPAGFARDNMLAEMNMENLDLRQGKG